MNVLILSDDELVELCSSYKLHTGNKWPDIAGIPVD